MTDCDKYLQKAKIGLILFFSIFIFIIFKNEINKNSLLEFMGVLYILGVGFAGIYYVLPYIRCIVDYNQSHKSPFK